MSRREPKSMTANCAAAARDHRIGREILGHAESVARSPGLGELRLHADALMAGDIPFCGRLGCRIDREEERAPERQDS